MHIYRLLMDVATCSLLVLNIMHDFIIFWQLVSINAERCLLTSLPDTFTYLDRLEVPHTLHILITSYSLDSETHSVASDDVRSCAAYSSWLFTFCMTPGVGVTEQSLHSVPHRVASHERFEETEPGQ